MDTVSAVSIVITFTAIVSWMSLRWRKTTIIGVPLLSSAATFSALAFLDGSRNTGKWCAEVEGIFDQPLIFQYTYTFVSHLKWSWAILIGYAVGVGTHLWINRAMFK